MASRRRSASPSVSFSQQIEGEVASDDGGVRQRGAAFLAHALEAAGDDEADAFRDIQRGNLEVGAPAALRVEELALFREVLEHLLDEERVAFGLAVDRLNERCRRALAGQRLEHRLDTRFG